MRGLSHKVRTVIGVILIILAIITGPIPIIQGWMFFLAAVGVLGTDHVIIKWCYRQMERGKQWVLRLRKKKDPQPKV